MKGFSIQAHGIFCCLVLWGGEEVVFRIANKNKNNNNSNNNKNKKNNRDNNNQKMKNK